jgi:hypothetical protein
MLDMVSSITLSQKHYVSAGSAGKTLTLRCVHRLAIANHDYNSRLFPCQGKNPRFACSKNPRFACSGQTPRFIFFRLTS